MDAETLQHFEASVALFARAVTALAEIEAMRAENFVRATNNQALAYGEDAFLQVLENGKLTING